MSVIANTKSGHKESADIIDMQIYQNNRLNNTKEQAEFMKSIMPEGLKVPYGIANKPRDKEPSMSELMTWGLDAPNKSDLRMTSIGQPLC